MEVDNGQLADVTEKVKPTFRNIVDRMIDAYICGLKIWEMVFGCPDSIFHKAVVKESTSKRCSSSENHG